MVSTDRDRNRTGGEDAPDIGLDELVRADEVADGDRRVSAVDEVVRIEQVDVVLERPWEGHVRGDPQAARTVRRAGALDRGVAVLAGEAEEGCSCVAAGKLRDGHVGRAEEADHATRDGAEVLLAGAGAHDWASPMGWTLDRSATVGVAASILRSEIRTARPIAPITTAITKNA